jgi:hypothetical protein
MRGFIDKREKGWFVKYVALSNHDVGTIIKELPLHPYTLQEIIELSERFDNLEARIFENPSVDFTIIEECFNYNGTHFCRECGCKEGFVQYAKIKISDKF